MSFAQPFSNYEILDRIGSGSMGTVFKARQKHMDRIVALKVLKPALARNARYVDRLRREARIVGKLSHPNIVTGYDLGEEAGYHFFVMELVEGPSLRELLTQWGSFPETQVLDVATQIAEALDHAWQQGVIHRDIKPGNVLITDDGHVKLTDMGLAKGATDLTLTRDGATVGTPQYISPEQSRDSSQVDIRSDLYSLGATLFHMATGQPPFRADSIGELITKVLSERPPSVTELKPELSDGLSLVIRKLLAKDPELRYQNPRELLDDLERVRRAERPAVDVAALSREHRQRAGLRRGPLFGVIAVVALVAGLVLWAVWPRGPEPELDRSAEIAAFQATIDSVVAAGNDLDYPERFAQLNELRLRSLDEDQRQALGRAETALSRELDDRIGTLFAGYFAERRAESEGWLADPEHWTDAAGFERAVVDPELRELCGYRASALPSAELRVSAQRRLQILRGQIEAAVERRDTSYLRRWEQYARDELFRPVRADLRGRDFASATRRLDERPTAFDGQDGRPPLDRLSPELRARIEADRAALREELNGEIAAARAAAAEALRRDAENRLAAVTRLRDELAAAGKAPGQLSEAIDRTERELRRHHPSAAAFAGEAGGPWMEIEAALRGLRGDFADLRDAFERDVFDDVLSLSYRICVELGPGEALRLLRSSRELSPRLQQRRLRHEQALQRALWYRDTLVDSLLDGADKLRIDDLVLLRDEDGYRFEDSRGQPLGCTEIPWAALAERGPSSFANRLSSEPELREGQAFWWYLRGDPARAQTLLGDDALGFYAEELWPRLAAMVGAAIAATDTDRALAEIQQQRSEGDYAAVTRLLAEFEQRHGQGELAERSREVRADLADWARIAGRREALQAAIEQKVPAGFAVTVDEQGLARVSGRAGDLGAEVRPVGWESRDAALWLGGAGPGGAGLEPDQARSRRMALKLPFADGDDLRFDLELAFAAGGQEPRLAVIEVRGLALALCALPSGALAAAVLPESGAYDPAQLERALAGPIHEAQLRGLRVLPGEFFALRLEVGYRRGGELSLRASLPDEGVEELCRGRRKVSGDGAAELRVGGFQDLGLRGVTMRGRAET